MLLARVGDDILAVGAECTHYSGPLNEGMLAGDTIRCPLHHACFSLRTGEAISAPAFAPLPCWLVERDGDHIVVRKKVVAVPQGKSPHGTHPRNIVIVGGGAAGFACAGMLRRRGFAGRLTMLSEDTDPPCNVPRSASAAEVPSRWWLAAPNNCSPAAVSHGALIDRTMPDRRPAPLC